MAVSTPIFPQSIKNTILQLTSANTTTPALLYAGGTNGSKIELINVTSTDTTARDLILYVQVSATNYQLATISIPITAGSINSATSINYLTNAQFPKLPVDINGNTYIYLASGYSLYMAVGVTITAAKNITIFCQGGEY